MQEAQVQFLVWEDSLDKEMATHSSILAWEIPGTGEPGGSYQTHLAAKEVYRFLNVENRIASVYRYGPHDHRFEDFCHFFDFIECAINERAYLKDNADQVMNMPFLFKQN